MQGLVYFGLERAASASRGRSFPPRSGAGGRGSPQFPFLVARFSAEVCRVSQGLSAECGGFYSWWQKSVLLYLFGDVVNNRVYVLGPSNGARETDLGALFEKIKDG